jgi:hypothetical protein
MKIAIYRYANNDYNRDNGIAWDIAYVKPIRSKTKEDIDNEVNWQYTGPHDMVILVIDVDDEVFEAIKFLKKNSTSEFDADSGIDEDEYYGTI